MIDQSVLKGKLKNMTGDKSPRRCRMRKFLIVTILVAAAIPLGLRAADNNDIREMLSSFKACLRADDHQKAAGYLSPRFVNALKAAGDKTQPQSGQGYAFLQEDPVEFVKSELDGTFFEDFDIDSIKKTGNIATADLKLKNGKLVKLFLEKETGGWKITPVPPDVFQESIKKDQVRIHQLDEKRHAIEWRQHLADDINADRWDDGWYWSER